MAPSFTLQNGKLTAMLCVRCPENKVSHSVIYKEGAKSYIWTPAFRTGPIMCADVGTKEWSLVNYQYNVVRDRSKQCWSNDLK